MILQANGKALAIADSDRHNRERLWYLMGDDCDFYSPNYTYAFYKEDDRYVLDITSVLGESLSQTVNIIDDDNIEIVGASLKRME